MHTAELLNWCVYTMYIAKISLKIRACVYNAQPAVMGLSSFLLSLLTVDSMWACNIHVFVNVCIFMCYTHVHIFTELQVPTCTCACDCSLPSALDFKSLPRCPQESGMGACIFPTAGKGRGKVLGYLLSDITEEVTGVLRLSYYNGAKCSNGRSHVVNIFFQCEKGAGVVSDVNIFMYMSCVHICVHFLLCVYIHCTCYCTYVHMYMYMYKHVHASIIKYAPLHTT